MGWNAPAHQQFFPFIGGGVHDSVLMIVPPVPCKLFHLSLSVLQGTYFLSFCFPSFKIGADQAIRIDESDEVGDASDAGGDDFHGTYGPGTIPFMGRTTDAGFFVPHISIPPNNSMLPLTFIFGSSISIFGANAIKLKTHSFLLSALFGDDDQGMACCIPPAPISLNVACQDPIPLPFDLVISPCSVEVGVTLADVWAALIDYALEIGFELAGAAAGELLGGLKKGGKKLFGSTTEVVEDAGQKAAKESLSELNFGSGWKKKLPFADWGQARLMKKGTREAASQAAEEAAQKASKEAAQESAEKLGKESAQNLDKAGKRADEAADSAKRADAAAKQADDAATEARKGADEAENARKGADDQVNKAKGDTGRAHNQADEAKKQADRAGKQADEVGEQADQAGRRADDAADQADRAGKQADQAGEQADQAGRRADEAKDQADQARRQADDAKGKADQARKQADEARRQADEMKRNAKEFRKQADEAQEQAAKSGEFKDRTGAGELDLDAKNLRDKAADLNRQAKQLEQAADGLDGQVKQLDEAAESLENGAKQADEAASSARKQADELKGRADELKGRADEAKRQADELKGRADEAKRQADEAKGRADEAKRRADEATDDLAKKQKQLDDAKRAEADAQKKADQAGKDADAAKKKADQALGKRDEAKEVFDEAEEFHRMTPEEKAKKILQDAYDDYYKRNPLGRILPADEFDFIPIAVGNLGGRLGGQIMETQYEDVGEDLLEAVSDPAEHPSVQLTSSDITQVGSEYVTDESPITVRVRFSKTVRGFGLKHVRTNPPDIASNMRVLAHSDRSAPVEPASGEARQDEDSPIVEVVGGVVAAQSPYTAQVFAMDVTPMVDPGDFFTVDVDAAQVAHEDDGGLLYPNKAAQQLRVRFENRGPVVALTSPVGQATNRDSVPFTASFNVPVTGFDEKGVRASNARIEGFMALSEREYRFEVKPSKEGPVQVKVPAGVAKGPSQRDNLASAVREFEYDKTAPELGVDVPIAGRTARARVPVKAEFSKPVESFGPDKIQVENARVASFKEVTPGRTYEYVLEPKGNGPVSARVPAGSVPDVAGNPNAESLVEFVYDNTSPEELLSGDFPGLPADAVARIQAGLEIIAGVV